MIVAGYYGFMLDIHVFVAVHLSVHISFPDDNLSNCQWFFSKLGMCIDIVEIWVAVANGQFHQFLTVNCSPHIGIFVSG